MKAELENNNVEYVSEAKAWLDEWDRQQDIKFHRDMKIAQAGLLVIGALLLYAVKVYIGG